MDRHDEPEPVPLDYAKPPKRPARLIGGRRLIVAFAAALLHFCFGWVAIVLADPGLPTRIVATAWLFPFGLVVTAVPPRRHPELLVGIANSLVVGFVLAYVLAFFRNRRPDR